MSQFADKLLPAVKLTLRENCADFSDEIKSYIDTCASNLQTAGILPLYFEADAESWECDPQILQAVRWYCQSVFGLFNTDSEKYMTSYNSLKATLCTQRKYTETKNGV